MNELIKSAGKALSKNSPTILTIGGVIGLGVTVVLACRATLRAQAVVEEHKENREKLEEKKDTDEYTKELAKVYSHTLAGFAKLYAVPAVIGVASVVAILGGHKILSDRNVKLTSSLAAMTTSYNELNKFMRNYRKRVKEDQGEDKDKEYAFGVKSDKVESVDEDGKKVNLKGNLHTADGVIPPAADGKLVSPAPYSFEFNSDWSEFKNSSAGNATFIHAMEEYWNRIYNVRKNQSHADGKCHPIYLNEILDSMGAPERVNPRIGWNPCDENSDGFIDFGLFDILYPINQAFRNGFSVKCILSFNCDGDVSDAEGAPVPEGFGEK